jgi:hypothetical protein
MRRGASSPPPEARRVRVRSRPLAEIDASKLALALSLMAKRLIEERQVVSDSKRRPASENEAREVA